MRDWSKIENAINEADSILLTTHENPDGDGIGSIIAIQHYLESRNKEYKILMTSHLPEEFQFIDRSNKFEYYDAKQHSEWLLNVDLAILLDIGNYTRTGEMWDVIRQNGTVIANIDHHPYPNGHPFSINIADVNASATGELVYDFLRHTNPKILNADVYEAIYIAIMTDTGSFSYSNTNVLCHEIAANAILAGVDIAKLHQKIYGSSSRARVKLLALIAGSINYDQNGKLAWFSINQKMMDESGAVKDDVDGFTDFVRAIKGVEVSLMIFEHSNGTCRINFRSKGSYLVNTIAQYFGGGGHSFAAGAKVVGTLEETVSIVVDKTKEVMTEQEQATK